MTLRAGEWFQAVCLLHVDRCRRADDEKIFFSLRFSAISHTYLHREKHMTDNQALNVYFVKISHTFHLHVTYIKFEHAKSMIIRIKYIIMMNSLC